MSKYERDADKEAFWRLALSEQRDSGLSVRAFCAREGLTQSTKCAKHSCFMACTNRSMRVFRLGLQALSLVTFTSPARGAVFSNVRIVQDVIRHVGSAHVNRRSVAGLPLCRL